MYAQSVCCYTYFFDISYTDVFYFYEFKITQISVPTIFLAGHVKKERTRAVQQNEGCSMKTNRWQFCNFTTLVTFLSTATIYVNMTILLLIKIESMATPMIPTTAPAQHKEFRNLFKLNRKCIYYIQ